MTVITYYTDRSRILQFQRCPRSRFEGYHRGGAGIASVSKPLPLAVGGAVHAGIEVLLRESQATLWQHGAEGMRELFEEGGIRAIEDRAVAASLADFVQYVGLELDATEAAAMQAGPKSAEGEAIAKSLGLAEDDPQVQELRQQVGANFDRFQKYLREEQAALVEAMVRAYARRRLRPLLEKFEILEVEREGQWTLSEWGLTPEGFVKPKVEFANQIVFMSRPDALLRDRETNELQIMSFKTTAGWDVRKARDAEHDMQGLSEGVEVEQRLNSWWSVLHLGHKRDADMPGMLWSELSIPMEDYLRGLSSPPRIHAIRYEYLLKGQRRIDKELTMELGMESRSQASHLVRAYLNSGMVAGEEKWAWSWDFVKDTGEPSKLHWKSWKATAVWEHMPIAQWIGLLDQSVPVMSTPDPTLGIEPQVLGWQSDAQPGFTPEHPLDSVFLPPVVVYRNDDDLRDWIDATESQERRVAEALTQVAAATEPGELRHLMNVNFPMHRQACSYPSTCQFARICYGGDELRRDPVASGQFEARRANHPQEHGGE